MKPLVTFVIPTIGRESIVRTIQSLKDQHNQNWKAFICGEISYETDDERITYIRHKGSAGENRNQALSRITTEWTAFVDDDDGISPDYVDKLIEESPGYDCIVWRMLRPDLGIMPRYQKIEWGNVGIHYALKTSLFHQFPFMKRKNQDYFQLIQVEEAGYKIKFSDHLLYYARTEPPQRPKEII